MFVITDQQHMASNKDKDMKKGYYVETTGKCKSRQLLGIEPRTPVLSCQYSATELRQPDNHQPPHSSICTAQMVLNASVTHLSMCHLSAFSSSSISAS